MNKEKEVSLFDIIIHILTNMKFVIYTFVFFVVMWLVLIIFSPPKYTSTSKVVADVSNKDNSSLSRSLSTLRSLGVNLGPSGSGLTPETYPKILKSNDVLYAVIHKNFYFKNLDTTITYLDFTKHKNLWYYLKKITIGLPSTISNLFKSKHNFKTYHDSTGQILILTKDEFKAILKLRNKVLNVSSDENTGIISVSVTTNDPLLSANLNKEIILSFRKRIQQIYSNRTSNNLNFIKKELNEARKRLNNSTQKLVDFMERNSNPSTIALKMELERLKNDLDFNRQFFNELKTQYTQTEIELKKKEPIVTIVEHPSPPVLPSGISKLGLLTLFMLMAFFVVLIKALVEILIVNIKSDNENLNKIDEIKTLIKRIKH